MDTSPHLSGQPDAAQPEGGATAITKRRTQLVSRRTLGPVLMLVAASLDEWLALSLVRLGVSVTRANGFFL
jgi:hypothetical protein